MCFILTTGSPTSPLPRAHPLFRLTTGRSGKEGERNAAHADQRRSFASEKRFWAERWSYRAHQKRLTHVTFQDLLNHFSVVRPTRHSPHLALPLYSTASSDSERNPRMPFASESLRDSPMKSICTVSGAISTSVSPSSSQDDEQLSIQPHTN